MPALFDLFKMSRLVKLKDGEITLMDTFVNIIPTALMIDLQKDLINALGFEKAYNQIYESAKTGSAAYNKSFIKRRGFKDKRQILNWQIKIVTFAGWGKLDLANIDIKDNRLTVQYNNSPLAKEYGKAKYPVCIIPAGFTAGGVSINYGTDLEAVETKCMAMGDPFCEIKIGPKKEIEALKKQLWTKWKLI